MRVRASGGMHTTLLLIWGLSAFLRRQGKRCLTPIVRSQQDSIYVQSPSLRHPCRLGFSERFLAEVLPVLAVELRVCCSANLEATSSMRLGSPFVVSAMTIPDISQSRSPRDPGLIDISGRPVGGTAFSW